MMIFTTRAKSLLSKAAFAFFWIAVWQFISMAVGQELLVASPLAVFKQICMLSQSGDFWQAILFSFGKIICGFLIAMGLGTVLGAISHCSLFFTELLFLPMTVIRNTPVASFIILVLIWVKSENVSVIICFLMVLPGFYINIQKGMGAVDPKLLEMAQVFNISFLNRFLYIRMPAILPFFLSACSLGMGMCWKAGIAAEVISTPRGSIGEKLYLAKLYLSTGELFAWTIVIIAISICFEHLFVRLVKKLTLRYTDEKA